MLISNETHLVMLRAVGAETIVHEGGSFEGVFSEPTVLTDGETPVHSRQPVIVCRAADVDRLAPLTILTVRKDQRFRLVRTDLDESGGEATLILKRIS